MSLPHAGRSLRALPPFLLLLASPAAAQVALPEVTVTAPQNQTAPASDTTNDGGPALQGEQPIAADRFGSVSVVNSEAIRRTGASTLGDLLFDKPGITGSGFAPGASSRPIIRGLDANRVRMQENGVAANGASDLGEDHFVPVDPLSVDRVEVIRGPETLRFGSQAIGGVVETSNNRIPTAIPPRGISGEVRGSYSSADKGADGAALVDAGAQNFAIHVDAFERSTQDYRVPSYPYMTAPSAAVLPNATQPGAFNGRQPNSSSRSNGQSVGASYIFADGFLGFALSQNNALYRIPGAEPESNNTRIDAQQTKLLGKGEWRAPNETIDVLRFWAGVTDYKHNELGYADPTNFSTDGVRQTFTNKEQEARVEAKLAPFDLRFAALTTTLGVQGGHQELTAPSPDGAGLWDPNSNRRIAGYAFNEFKFSDRTKAQIAGRIESVSLSGSSRSFDAFGMTGTTPASLTYTPKSVSAGLIQDLPLGLTGSITAQYVERAPKPAELFSGGPHDATATFDKGNTSLGMESARSLELGLRRKEGPFRFEATAYVTSFKGFIFRRLTGNTCTDAGDCSAAGADLNEALYSQADATFRGGEFSSQWDLLPFGSGFVGIEDQFDVVRATFTDGTNVPRIPPLRIGGGVYFRDPNWFARVRMIHAFAQNNIAPTAETTTGSYDDLRAELSYTYKKPNPTRADLSEMTVGISGSNLLNRDIRNSTSYDKDQVLMPGASVRIFATLKY